MSLKRVLIVVLACSLAGGVLWAQGRGGGSEWLTAGGDAQRTSWIRTDAAISVQSMSKPGFELQWKATLDNQARGSNGLAQGVTANGVTLFVPMSVVTGSSNNVYALDNDIGYTVWQRHFDAPLPAASAGCSGGITAAATRIVAAALPAPPRAGGGGGGGGGRGPAGYRGAVSEPGDGAPVLSGRGGGPGRGAGPAPTGAAGGAASGTGAAGAGATGAGGAGAGAGAATTGSGVAAVPPDPARAGGAGAGAPGPTATPPGRGAAAGNAGIPGAAGGGGVGSGFGRPAGVVYVVASDGMLHVLGLASGKDLQKPAVFLPPNARWSDPIAVGETMFAATSQNCGGAPNGIWAIDLAGENKSVTSWTTNGGGILGPLAVAADGTLIAAIGPGPVTPGGYTNAIVALDPKTLHVKDWFTSPTVELASSPLFFRHNDKDIVATVTRDGRVVLLDATSLGGVDHATPLFASRALSARPAAAPEALATWQEMLPAPNVPAAAGAPLPAPAVQPGRRWLLMPIEGRLTPDGMWPPAAGAITTGAIVALEVVDDGGKLSLRPDWVSRDLTSPATPIIVNGVVFAVAKGKAATPASGTATAMDAARSATPAVLYAMKAADGKDLWNSGATITSYAAGRSFWSASGQVYVGAFDGTVYAFGFPMERK
jgi:hypothetical protein